MTEKRPGESDFSTGAATEQLSEHERRGDELRRAIETTLYTEMLIPDARGDVLATGARRSSTRSSPRSSW